MLALAAACGHASAFQPEAFEAAPCGFWIPQHERATCGYVLVPESYSQPESRTIKLFTAVFHAVAEEPAPDPVIYITGGPGEAAFEEDGGAGWWWFSEPFRRQRDFVVFDQRGVGRSRPSLDCPELDAVAAQARVAPRSTALIRAAEVDATRACRHRLRGAGIDLDAYSTAEIAQDVITLASALEAERVNLMAISYGTRVALTALRQSPRSLRSLVLDSPYPPGVYDLAERPRLIARVYRQLYQDCSFDLLCAAAFPDLEQRFLRTVDALHARPAVLPAPDGGPQAQVTLTADMFVASLSSAFLSLEDIRLLPAVISAADEGSFDSVRQWVAPQVFASPTLSEGMRLSVECRENVPFSDHVVVAKRLRDYAPYGGSSATEPEWTLCEQWDVGQVPASFHDPVAGTVPTLLLTGTYDPIAPPEWSYRQATTLSRATVLEFVNATHGVTTDVACAEDAAVAFLDNPDQDVTRLCPRRMARPQFYTRQ